MIQMAVLSGAVTGLGVLVVLRELVPATPHLRTAIARLTAEATPASSSSTTANGRAAPEQQQVSGLTLRVGRLLDDRVGGSRWARTPLRDLAVLQLSAAAWFGQKGLLALVGLLFGPLMALTIAVVGVSLPFAVPAVASLVLAGVLWFVPDIEVRARSASARAEFARAVVAYIDLTALERAGGTGSTQSLENAAQIGGSWVFERIREALHRARWGGASPWRALSELAEELGVPELDDLADIMRLSGEEGVAVADNLRSRSRSMRTALLSREQARANADSEQMVVPVALLGLLFLCLLAYPAIVRVL